jgi:enoyl-CoA hydratase
MGSGTRVEIAEGVAWITLDDGKVNALSSARLRELGEALDRAERAAAVTVLTGREGIFSAGFDLGTFQRGAAASIEMVRAGAELVLRLLAFPRPVLGVCTGHAYPMGAFLMLASDVRLGAAGPFRIGMNEVAIGITVPKFAVELARHRLTAPGFARITTGAMFTPEDALRFGYLDRILAPDELAAAAQEEALRLCALPAGSYAATKARIRAAVDEELRSLAA